MNMRWLAHLRAILALPGVVLGLIPAVLFWLIGSDSWRLTETFPQLRMGLLIGGMLLMICGLYLMACAIRLFEIRGEGTLAPWDPPKKLVISGIYRHVRNPMMTGVFFVLGGEVLVAASIPLLIWFVLFVPTVLLFIPWFEEPGLAQRFGGDYRRYCQHVPRWIPRWTPWISESENGPEVIGDR